jgi:Ca2+-binding RTX toxin-like protein
MPAVTPTGGSSTVTLGTVTLVLNTYEAAQLNSALAALMNDPDATLGLINAYVPGSLSTPAVARLGRPPESKPIKGAVNIEYGTPAENQTVELARKAQGVVLTGTTDALVVGHAANHWGTREALFGNDGNDTIRGGGGSGIITGGTGANQVHTGKGSFLINLQGNDTVFTGAGSNVVETIGSATVHGGSGFTVFMDRDNAAGLGSKAVGGSGTLVAYSGLGSDTLVGGSGASFLVDTGPGHVDFKIVKGVTGTEIISGFNHKAGDFVQLAGFGPAFDPLKHLTVIGGSSYLHLGSAIIEFVGITNLTEDDFHH